MDRSARLLRLLAIVGLALMLTVGSGCAGNDSADEGATVEESEGTDAGDGVDESGDEDATDDAGASDATGVDQMDEGAEDFVGTWKDMTGNVGPFDEFTLDADGTASVTYRDGTTSDATWSVEDRGAYFLTVAPEDGGDGLANAMEWVSDSEFKRMNADGSWVRQ
jgi:hypothetical protein